MARVYIDILMQGTPLSNEPSKEEKEKRIFDDAKHDELRRLAKEEAKAERLAARQAIQKK